MPRHNGQPADLVLGQASFECRDENGGGEPSDSSMRWPHAITTWSGTLCVTDAGNNRILIWDHAPVTDNQAADVVLGQADFRSVDHNQSLYWPSAASLHMPYGVTAAGPWCLCADTANSRLIAWHIDDCRSGAAARALTGQSEFNAKGDNAWRAPTRTSLSWPYGISAHGSVVLVADSGNNRVLLWPAAAELIPERGRRADPRARPGAGRRLPPDTLAPAQRHGLRGWVANDGQGVRIHVCGPAAAVEEFVLDLPNASPPLARIDRIERESAPPLPDGCGISHRRQRSTAMGTGVAPDAATCAECVREIFDPFARRYRYPFTNCTHCGPRLSIIRQVPYDRAHTTMAGFSMCPACAAEYHDPANRRFHAQPSPAMSAARNSPSRAATAAP